MTWKTDGFALFALYCSIILYIVYWFASAQLKVTVIVISRGCLWVCPFVCPDLGGQMSRKLRKIEGRLLLRAYRKVARGYRMVMSTMTSRDSMTS